MPGDTIEISAGSYLPAVIDVDDINLRAATDSAPVIDSTGVRDALIVQSDGVTVEGLRVENAERIAFFVLGDNNVLRNNVAENNGNGFVIFRGEHNLFSDNIALSNGNEGFGIFEGHNNVLRNNFAGGGEEGVALRGTLGSSNNWIEGNRFEGNVFGVFHPSPSSGNVLLHNVVANSTTDDYKVGLLPEGGTLSITISTTQGPLNLALEAPTLGAATTIVYAASPRSAEFYLDQTLSLDFAGDFFQDFFGFEEKWLLGGDEETWYFITPDGNFYRWNGGGPLDRTWLSQLDSATYINPSLLYDAQSNATSLGRVSLAEQKLVMSHDDGFVGSFSVDVTGSNGTELVSSRILVNVMPNQAPILSPLADQTLPTNQDTLDVTLFATDPAADELTFSATVLTGEYYLDQTLGLEVFQDELFTNWSDRYDEKWLINDSGDWYFIMPDGGFWRWSGGDRNIILNSELIAQLTPAAYADPALLHDAQSDTRGPAAVTLSDDVLTLNPDEGFVGTFSVLVTVTDEGALTDSALVRVDVTPAPAVAAKAAPAFVGKGQPIPSRPAIEDARSRGHAEVPSAEGSPAANAIAPYVPVLSAGSTAIGRDRISRLYGGGGRLESNELPKDLLTVLATDLVVGTQ